MAKALKYREDLSHLDPSYKGLYLNVIPSADLNFTLGEPKPAPSDLPSPLVKSPESTLTGYQSGKRSALLPASDSDGPPFWRLKGCGNFTHVFNELPM